MSIKRICGLVLAAGYSSRMGRLKALLPFGQGTMLSSAIESLRRAGIGDIYVVVGHEADQIMAAYPQGQGVYYVHNPDFARGMLTSVQAGVRAMGACHKAFLMLPVDCPAVSPQTIQGLAKAFEGKNAAIIRPVYQGKAGHPALFSMAYRQEILSGDLPQGLRTLQQNHGDALIDIDTPDAAVGMDIDNPEAYQAAMANGPDKA